ncbi:uncharacterized mitochondrial protein AtMg00820-like [Nicotiana tomentosiformis]|uniref:uncharacterized mitochondrial protein AtMg00820-like n=1 Tax=Nicotiana tomentosiformis TaxID=4098 RepID=UPI0014466119|nr:uncharacterized mitochondrial protein AtMg00820-like [Nicotiana tomentosiformis]
MKSKKQQQYPKILKILLQQLPAAEISPSALEEIDAPDESLRYSDPTTFENVVKEEKWRKAMDDEIDAIERNDTCELSDLPKGHKTIGVKWVFKTKLKEDGEVDKYKARLLAKGYKQEYGINYREVFAPVARHDTIILVIALAA